MRALRTSSSTSLRLPSDPPFTRRVVTIASLDLRDVHRPQQLVDRLDLDDLLVAAHAELLHPPRPRQDVTLQGRLGVVEMLHRVEHRVPQLLEVPRPDRHALEELLAEV